jgi:hypothetical protein
MVIDHDNFIVGLVKGKVSEVLDRLDRERPELPQEDRQAIVVRLGLQGVKEALVSRPDLAGRFEDIAAESYLRAVTSELLLTRST